MEDGRGRPDFSILHSPFSIPHPPFSIPHPPSSILRALGAGLVALFLLFEAAVPASAQILPAFGNDRKGTAGFQFLKIPVDARAAAMGETVVANAFDASALFWNPALAAQTPQAQIGISHTAYYTDINLEYAAAIYHVGGFTLGASLQALNSGDMEVTTEFQPQGTGETFRLVDVALGLTVAQQLTDLFSYGVTGRYVQESVVDLTTRTAVVDLGIFYRIGTTGAQMAVAIRNLGIDAAPQGSIERTTVGTDGGVVVEDDFESITPPTTFLLGISYDVFHRDAANDLLVSGQLTHLNDNAESFNVGVEYVWNRTLALRGGYRFGVDEFVLPSLGAGLMLPELSGLGARFDYAFSHLERLGTVHRVGLNLSL